MHEQMTVFILAHGIIVLKGISSFYAGVCFSKRLHMLTGSIDPNQILNRFKISSALNLDNSYLYASLFRLYNGNSF
jgi:hypothetical protein